MRPVSGTITDPAVDRLLNSTSKDDPYWDKREELIGRSYSGLEGRVTVTGIPDWSTEYVEVELADGTPSVRAVEHVRNALRRKNA